MQGFASDVAMVRPAAFQFNTDTAPTNHFQVLQAYDATLLQQHALAEFDALVQNLQQNHIGVLVLDDPGTIPLPDAIFPNNWFISLPGELLICPMQAASRRMERRPAFIRQLVEHTHAAHVIDWSKEEEKQLFLEGTGSLVIDHENKRCYACRSGRTSQLLFEKFCAYVGYQGFIFSAEDRLGRAIYHTNVMMCLGNRFALVCEEAMPLKSEREDLRKLLANTGHVLIPISFSQMECFAGNMLQLQNRRGEFILVMSNTAHAALTDAQLRKIESHTHILQAEVKTIETAGGGGVRCMMAELFPPV